MLIKEKALQHWIEHFYGYGSWHAPIWFVGYEESGGDLPEEVAEKLNYFYDVHAASQGPVLCNIRDLHRHVSFRGDGPRSTLFTTQFEYRFGNHAILHGIWKNLIAFRHGYNNEEIPELLNYQKETFAAPSVSREALIQLYPLPSPHNHAWYYAWLDVPPSFQFIRNRAGYQQHVYGQRIRTILENISVNKPEVVLMYGMDNINVLKNSVQDFFSTTKFRMVKAIPRQSPQYHRADFDGTTLLITTQVPALKHNRVETGFDWYTLGKNVKSGN